MVNCGTGEGAHALAQHAGNFFSVVRGCPRSCARINPSFRGRIFGGKRVQEPPPGPAVKHCRFLGTGGGTPCGACMECIVWGLGSGRRHPVRPGSLCEGSSVGGLGSPPGEGGALKVWCHSTLVSGILVGSNFVHVTSTSPQCTDPRGTSCFAAKGAYGNVT